MGVILLLISACDHQYLAIPNSEVIAGTPQYAYENVWAGTVTPTYVVTEGVADLTVGESVTFEVSFEAAFEFTVTELVVLGLENGSDDTSFGDHWRIPLDDEEIAAKKASITVSALDAEPTTEWCTPKHLGTWTCYQRADKGTRGVGLAAAGDDTISMYTPLALTLPSLEPTTDPGNECDGATFEDCCGGTSGISVVQCAWDPACACPDGTADAGYDSQGYRLCNCPG